MAHASALAAWRAVQLALIRQGQATSVYLVRVGSHRDSTREKRLSRSATLPSWREVRKVEDAGKCLQRHVDEHQILQAVTIQARHAVREDRTLGLGHAEFKGEPAQTIRVGDRGATPFETTASLVTISAVS